MYTTFLMSELKKWFRDPMMKFMLVFPIIFGLLGRYALPVIAEASGFKLENFADLVLVILTLMTPQMFGALLGFSILDDRDDHILTSIKVSPLSVHQFLSFRLAAVTVLAFLASVFVVWFSDIVQLPLKDILIISFITALAAPMVGLLINVLASNKIEGFAIMKGTGAILFFPMIALFFRDAKEMFFAFAPGFWPAKAISSLIRGEGVLFLGYQQYIIIGLVYVIVVNLLMYYLFLRKVKF